MKYNHIIEVIRYRGKAVSSPCTYVDGHLFRIDRKVYLVTTPRIEEINGQKVIPQMYLTEIIEDTLEVKLGSCKWVNILDLKRMLLEETWNIEGVDKMIDDSIENFKAYIEMLEEDIK